MITIPIWAFLFVVVLHGAFCAQRDIITSRWMSALVNNDQYHRDQNRLHATTLRARAVVSEVPLAINRGEIMYYARDRVRSQVMEFVKARIRVTEQRSDYHEGTEVEASIRIWGEA